MVDQPIGGFDFQQYVGQSIPPPSLYLADALIRVLGMPRPGIQTRVLVSAGNLSWMLAQWNLEATMGGMSH